MTRFYQSLILASIMWAFSAAAFSNTTCGIFHFDQNLVDKELRQAESNRLECQNQLEKNTPQTVAVTSKFGSSADGPVEQIFWIPRGSGHFSKLPDFIRYEEARKRFYLDWEKFELAYNAWPVMQGRAEFLLNEVGVISPLLHCTTRQRAADRYALCTIEYKDKEHEIKWSEAHYVFEGANGVSAWYNSPLLSAQSIADQKMLRVMTSLFRSMSTQP